MLQDNREDDSLLSDDDDDDDMEDLDALAKGLDRPLKPSPKAASAAETSKLCAQTTRRHKQPTLVKLLIVLFLDLCTTLLHCDHL